jgi:hypothetical protein
MFSNALASPLGERPRELLPLCRNCAPRKQEPYGYVLAFAQSGGKIPLLG